MTALAFLTALPAPANDAALPLASVAPLVIREELGSDVVAREALLDAAMGAGRKRKSSETIRRGRLAAKGLSFSAGAEDGSLAGTVRLWHVAAGEAGGRSVPALLLGPLAVRPDLAGRGIGVALMERAINAARACGHDAILLVGDPSYYERFGFSAAPAAELAMPGPFERHRLLALELVPGALAEARGIIRPAGRRVVRPEARRAAV